MILKHISGILCLLISYSKFTRSKTEEGLTCLQVKDILKTDLSKKGVVGIMRNGIGDNFDRQTDVVCLNVGIINKHRKQYRYQLC